MYDTKCMGVNYSFKRCACVCYDVITPCEIADCFDPYFSQTRPHTYNETVNKDVNTMTPHHPAHPR